MSDGSDISDVEYSSADSDSGLDYEGSDCSIGMSETEADAFDVLKREQLDESMQEDINKVCIFEQISRTTGRLLLNHHKWNVRLITEKLCDQKEELFASANLPNPFKIKAPSQETNNPNSQASSMCGVCFDECQGDMMLALDCGHCFCKECWRGHIQISIKDQKQCVECQETDCRALMEDDVVLEVIEDEKLKSAYLKVIVQGYVSCDKSLQVCPGVDCQYVVRAEDVGVTVVTCKCKEKFCFGCGQPEHDPVGCDLLRLWKKKNVEDSESNSWIVANTKDCPKCRTPIHRYTGCKHMVCLRTGCGHHFCWVCMEPDLNYCHTQNGNCDRYDAGAKASKSSAREAQERYDHHFTRYTNHAAALKFQEKMADKVKAKEDEMVRDPKFRVSTIEASMLSKALQSLLVCRHTLMYTYVFAFYVRNGVPRELFESNQALLEGKVEELSGFLERELGDHDTSGLLQTAESMRRLCLERRTKLVEHIRDGHSSGCWEFDTSL